MRTTATTLLAALAAALLCPAPAAAGNRFTFPVGGRASAMAGAYAALADDPATAWWNPAGLGWVQRSSLDLSTSAYSLQLVRIPEFLRTTLPSGDYPSGFSASPFQVVTPAITYVWRIGGGHGDDEAPPPGTAADGAPAASPAPRTARGPVRHVVAFSVIVPVSESFSQTAAFDTVEPGGPFHQRFSLSRKYTEYHIGPAWGARFGNLLSFGLSLYGIYATSEARATFATGLEAVPEGGTDPVSHFGALHAEAATTMLGLALQAGLQVRPVSGLRLGLAVRLPVLRVYGKATGTQLQTASVDDDGNLAPVFRDVDLGQGSKAAFTWPLTLTLGLAWQTPGVFSIAVDADYTTRWDFGGSHLRNHFNGRLGIEAFLAPRWVLGFGAFTDVSPWKPFGRNARNESFVDLRMDFYGGTLAVTWLSPYVVVGSDRTDRITFSYTVGARYAYGMGRIVGMDLDYTGAGATNAFKDVRVHEISLIVGSGVRF
jgi:long-subunit fatty acid transport protein